MIDKEKLLKYLDEEITYNWEMAPSLSSPEFDGRLRTCGRIKEKINRGEFDYREEIKQ